MTRSSATPLDSQFEAAVAELRNQGLTIRIQSESNRTWYVRSAGAYTGYIVTGEELLELKRKKKLNIHEIQALG